MSEKTFFKVGPFRFPVFFIAIVTAVLLCASGAVHAADFPVEIKHRFGVTLIEAKPEKIVSVGFIEHDFLLALGIAPHGLRKWYGSDPYGVWPWGQEALGDATPHVMQGEINVEEIASLEPDLIVGQWSGMSSRDYALLSQIAPTLAVAEGAGDYGMSWEAMLRAIGRATGTSQKAESIIARLEARFAALRDSHPEWQGASAAVVWAGQTGAYTDDDIRGQLLENLGFEIPEAINKMGRANNFYVLIPPENLEPIDTDVLIWIDTGGGVSALETMPLRPFMRAYEEGREIYAGPVLSAALSHSSPLSLDYVLDRLVPMLEQAVDGDPATLVKSSAEAGILKPAGVN